MTPQEIIENNVKIQRFLCEIKGIKSLEEHIGAFVEPYSPKKFHTSWDLLMPIIQDIENKTGWILVMASGYAYFTDGNGSEHEIGEMNGWQSIANIFDCVIQFIDWYNSQNQKP